MEEGVVRKSRSSTSASSLLSAPDFGGDADGNHDATL